MPINYGAYSGMSPQQVYAANPNGLPVGFSWADYQAAQPTGSSWATANLAAPTINVGGQQFDPWGYAAWQANNAAPAPPRIAPVSRQRTPSSGFSFTPPPPVPMTAPSVNPGEIALGDPQINIAADANGTPLFPPPGTVSAPTAAPASGTTPPPSPTSTPLGLGPWGAFNPWGGTSAAGNENRNLSYQGLDPRLDQLLTYGLSQAMMNYLNPAGQSYYGGPTVAGLTPEEQQAQQMLLGVANNTSGIASGATGFLDSLLQNGMNPGMNPQVDAVVNATLRDVTRQATDPGGVFSQIRSNSIGNNAYGGTRQGVLESLALGRLADSLGKTSADIRLNARGQDISSGIQGLGQQGNVTNLATLPATLYGGVGAQNRGMNQAFMNDALTRWLYDTNQPNTRLQSLFNFINAAPLGGWGSGSQWLSDAAINSGGTSTAQNVAGGLAGAGSIISILHDAGII